MSPASTSDVVSLAQQLIRFETSNPPGNERACVQFIAELLSGAGLQTTIKALDPGRPNLIARFPGRGERAPLLLHGHVDVVPAAAERWQRDPFAGEIVNGELWGRGAIDMKGGIAMMLSAILRIADSGASPAGDVIFAALSDEECGSSYGAKFLVEQHPELFAGARHALGEFGAIARAAQSANVYFVPVAEKQWCSLSITLRGAGGHAALPVRGSAVARLARLLNAVAGTRLPVHVSRVSHEMIHQYADALEPARAASIRALSDPGRTDAILDGADGTLALFDAALHNTLTPTVIRAGERNDANPETIALELDGRVLPDRSPQHLLAELQAIAGDDLEIELTHVDVPPATSVDNSLLPVLGDALRRLDRAAHVVPMLNPGVTDGRFFARLGIQHHGFLPMQLPDPGAIIRTMHGVDERIPLTALEFGTSVYESLLRGS